MSGRRPVCGPGRRLTGVGGRGTRDRSEHETAFERARRCAQPNDRPAVSGTFRLIGRAARNRAQLTPARSVPRRAQRIMAGRGGARRDAAGAAIERQSRGDRAAIDTLRWVWTSTRPRPGRLKAFRVRRPLSIAPRRPPGAGEPEKVIESRLSTGAPGWPGRTTPCRQCQIASGPSGPGRS